MSFSTPNKESVSQKSQSYPGTPRSQHKVCVNLSDVFQGYENDLTITQNDQSTAYQSALENNEAKPLQISTAVSSLQEMEQIRNQLQSVLQPTIKETTSPVDPLNSSSTSSVDTIALLRSALPHSSPELQLDENGVLMSSLTSSLSRKLYQPTTSPTLLDSSLVAENNILKDNIEKERCRRKLCEQQIHELQDKLLESQEQLAVASSAERKKGIMIEQLDQTLASVVDGWKKQETSRMESYNQIKQQNEELEASKTRQEELLKKFEVELREAVDSLIKEQEKYQELENLFQEKCHTHDEEKDRLQTELKSLREENLTLEEQKHNVLEQTRKEMTDKDEIMLDLRKCLEQEKLQMKNLTVKSNDTEKKLARIVQELEEKLNSTKSKVAELSKSLKEKDEKMRSVHSDLENVTKEKETLSMEVALLNSKYDALKTKQDSEVRLKLEAEFNEQILEIQKQITMTENELRNSQKKQITDLSKKHREEMDKQKKSFHQDLLKKDEMLNKLQADYDRDLEDARNEISSLSMAGQSLETQRTELMNRMKYMMQQHWEETVSLLNTDSKLMGNTRYSQAPHDEQFSSTFRSDFQQQQQQQQQQQHPIARNHNSGNFYGSRRHQTPITNNDDNRIRLNGFDSQSSSATQPVLPGHFPPYAYHDSRDEVAPYHSGIAEGVSQDPFVNNSHRNDSNHKQHLNRTSSPLFKSNTEGEYLPWQQSSSQSYQQNTAPIRDQFLKGRISTSAHKAPVTSSPVKNITSHTVTSALSTSSSNQQYNFRERLDHNTATRNYTATMPPLDVRENARITTNNAGGSTLPQHGEYRLNNLNNPVKGSDDPVSLLYQDINEDLDVTDAKNNSVDDTNKQHQLGHFIEKLLERSPGQPLDEIPVKDVTEERIPESIKEEVDVLLHHTPKKQPIRNNAAFRKSVLKKSPDSKDRKKDSSDEQKNFTEEELMHMLKQLIISKQNPGNSLKEKKAPYSNFESEGINSTQKDLISNANGGRKNVNKKSAESKPSLQRKSGKVTSTRNVPSKDQKRDTKPRTRTSSAWK